MIRGWRWLVAGVGLIASLVALSGCGGRSPAPTSTSTDASMPTGTSQQSANTTPAPMGVPGNWQLVLNAVFPGHSLDTKLWQPGWFGTGITGPINAHEMACYSSSNVIVPGDGTVHLNLTNEPSTCGGRHDNSLTGAVLSTNPHDGRASGGFSYRYGLIEAKVWIPGKGRTAWDWPTIMTLGQSWPKDGEDDLLESLSGVICVHFHSPGFTGGANGVCDSGITPGWHTVAADWEPGSVTWYYDGVAVDRTTQGVTSDPMYVVLLNTASSHWASLSRADSLQVAYVRVWQHPRDLDSTS